MVQLVALLVYRLWKIQTVLHDIGMDGFGLLLYAIEPEVAFLLFSAFYWMVKVPLRKHKAQI